MVKINLEPNLLDPTLPMMQLYNSGASIDYLGLLLHLIRFILVLLIINV